MKSYCLYFYTNLSALSSETFWKIAICCQFVSSSLWTCQATVQSEHVQVLSVSEEEVLCKYHRCGVGRETSTWGQSERLYQALFTLHTLLFVDWTAESEWDVQHCIRLLSKKCESAGKQTMAVFLTCDGANPVLVVSSDLLQFPFMYTRLLQ